MTAQPVPQSKLTPEVIEAISESLRVNANWEAAARYSGIDNSTIWRWRQRANNYANRTKAAQDLQAETADPDQPYWEAAQRWETARSRGEIELVATIRKVALAGDWRAAHAMLKMGWPDDYSDRVELTGAGGGPIQVSSEELEARALEMVAEIERKRDTEKAITTRPEPGQSADVSIPPPA